MCVNVKVRVVLLCCILVLVKTICMTLRAIPLIAFNGYICIIYLHVYIYMHVHMYTCIYKYMYSVYTCVHVCLIHIHVRINSMYMYGILNNIYMYTCTSSLK